MSRLKLLTRTVASAAFNFSHTQHCVLAAAAVPALSTHTNYDNYLITRNKSQQACFHRPISVLKCVTTRQPLGRFNEIQLQEFPTIWSCCRSLGTKSSPDNAGKSDSKSSSAAVAETDIFGDASKLGLFAKFKLMYKKYWYVLIPVHVVTSIGWLAGFYYMSKSGVDVPSLLQYIHLSETIIQKVQNSDMGHYAIAYLCYKVATPLRYAVTLGGSTLSIKYLVQAGHIKPMPSKQQLLDMYEQKKADRAAAKTNTKDKQ